MSYFAPPHSTQNRINQLKSQKYLYRYIIYASTIRLTACPINMMSVI